MKAMQRRFYIFGTVLSVSVILGLMIQYAYLNKVIIRDKQMSIINMREHLAKEINSQIRYYSQPTIAASKFITIKSWTDKEASEYFNRLRQENLAIKFVYFGDVNNNLIISDDWVVPDYYDLRNRDWYIQATESKALIISDIYVDASDKELVIAISKPVYNEDGLLLGVAASDISIDKIINIVEETRIKGYGYSFLIDGSGNILGHPEHKYSQNSELVSINSLSDGIHNKIKESKTGELKVKFDNVQGYLSFTPIGDTDWIIGNFISLKEFRGDNGDIWRIFLIALFIVIWIFISFSYIQEKSFLLPTLELDNDIEKINIEEDMGYRILIKEKDPFSEIRKTINQALNKTQELFEQTEQDTEEIMAQHDELEASYNQLSAMDYELRLQYTKAIESEEGLKKALERNDAIIQAMPDMLFIVNSDDIFVDMQASDKQELYIKEEDFLGKRFEEVVPLETVEEAKIKIQNVLKNNVLETLEYELKVPSGIQYYELRISRVNEDEAMIIARNVTTRRKSEDELNYLSYHDQLTGLYNRRYFEEQLKRLDVERNLPITLVMADVNGLKLINDSFGHKSGDELLISIANIIKSGCRADDIVSRISGDEFIVILPNTNEFEAERVIKRIKTLSRDKKFANKNFSDMELSVSFGLGTKHNSDMDISEMLKKAEDNMYSNKLFEGPSMRSKTIETIIKALYEKNKREEQHSARVSKLVLEMGIELKMKEDDLKELKSVGLLHDIGKIAISESILDKPGKLTEEEWEEMKKHPEIGYRILSTVNEMTRIAEYTLAHHERYDGRGYPKGLIGEQIPLVSRIISIADAYDAMASERPYKKALSDDEIVKEFIKNAGVQFDPQLARIFVEKVLGYQWKEE